jgi:uracil-DNA glycosylase
VIVGEAWGESEARARAPFVGTSGQELWRMLGEVVQGFENEHRRATRAMRYGDTWVKVREEWLQAQSLAFTNVLAFRPPNNSIGALCGPKEQSSGLPPLGRSDKVQFPSGPYLRPEYLPELARLYDEINLCKPHVIIASGNTACWATLCATNIGSIRGAVALSRSLDLSMLAEGMGQKIDGVKILPTYHPAGVLRQWSWRPIVVADLMKAFREAQWPELRRPQRQVLINPTLREVQDWVWATLAIPPPALSIDVETGQGQIKCIGFASSRSEALVVPFVDLAQPEGSYWATASEERAARELVGQLLASPIPKLFQNGLYDLQYIWREGWSVAACAEDTMLMHHSLFPELQKGLGFMGSIYTNEASWKLMRRPRADTEKRDE